MGQPLGPIDLATKIQGIIQVEFSAVFFFLRGGFLTMGGGDFWDAHREKRRQK